MAAYSQQDVIKRFMASLDETSLSGEDALNEAIRTCSSFDGFDDLKAHMLEDCANNNSDTFLQQYCGINLSNTDTGAITGKDAGGSAVKTASSIVPENASDTLIATEVNSVTVGGLTIKLSNGDNYQAINFGDLTSSDQEYAWRATVQWWAEAALNLIDESYVYSFYSDDATVKEIGLAFKYDPNNTMLAWTDWHHDYSSGKTNPRGITINTAHYYGLDTSSKDGKNTGTSFYLDRTLAHELTHCIMYAKIHSFNMMPIIIREGMAELTHGIDDERKSGISKLAGNAALLEESLVLSTTYNKNVSGVENPDYVAGYMLLRYLAKQASTNYLPAIATVNGTSYADGIRNTVTSAAVNVGGGNDTVTNTGNFVSISGGAGADSILNNGGSFINIDGGAGADSIYSYGGSAQISGGNDADYILLYNDASDTTVDGGAGNDIIYSGAHHALIEGGSGAEYIYLYNMALNTTVDGGADNDEIYSGGTNVSLSGGDGNDYIHVYSSATKTTVNGGKGSDTITSYSTLGTVYEYASGDGNDTIYGFSAKDTLQITSGTYETLSGSGDDVTVKVDSGYVILKSAKGQTLNINGKSKRADVSLTSGADKYENSVSGATIYGLGGNDTVSNKGTRTLIDGGAGKDTLRNYAGGVTLQGGAGDDYIYNSTSSTTTINSSYGYVTIDGGAGNDKIENNDPYVSISGGAGNDSIVVGSYNYVTVNAGAGNDTVVGNRNTYGVLYQYRSGDGNDILTAVNVNDTIHITSGSVSKASVSGSDVILTVGSNTINLKNYKGKSFNLKIGSGSAVSTVISGSSSSVVSLTGGNDNYENTLGSATIYGLAGNDTIRNLGASKVMIDGGAGKDSIFSYGSGVTVNAGNDADYVYIYSDAISTTALGGAGNDSIYTAGQTVSVSGDAGNDYFYVYANATKTTVNGGAGNDSIYTAGQTVSASGGDGNDYIHVYSNATKTTVNGGKGSDTITSYSTLGTLYQYANGDGKDTITGFSANDTLHVTSGSVTSSVSGSNVILKVGSGTITLKDYKGKSLNLKTGSGSAVSTVIGGGSSSSVVSLTSGADKYENSVSGATIYGLGGNDTISNTTTNVTIYGGAGNDSIDNRNRNVLVYGDAGNDKILNTSTNVTIFGGAGADSIENHSASSGATIHGDAGNDTIKSNGSFAQIFGDAGNDKISLGSYAQNITVEGGAGNDTLYSNGASNLFRYSSGHGNDTIIGSGSNDTLQISASYTTSVKGSDLIVKVGSNSITVKNYSSSRINITRGGSNGYWFADDTNFLGSTTLDDISKVTAENYSVTELSAPDFENFAQDNFPTITSGEK